MQQHNMLLLLHQFICVSSNAYKSNKGEIIVLC